MDGSQALEQVKFTYAKGQAYALIILDFNMPLMGGQEASIAIKNHLIEEKNIRDNDLPKIIGLTAHDALSFVPDQSKMDNIYQKPIHYNDLCDLINECYK